jgi:hypothetical protein
MVANSVQYVMGRTVEEPRLLFLAVGTEFYLLHNV